MIYIQNDVIVNNINFIRSEAVSVIAPIIVNLFLLINNHLNDIFITNWTPCFAVKVTKKWDKIGIERLG